MFESCICIYPDEICNLLSRTRPKARKEHKCIECGCIISIGEIYEKDATIYEHNFTTYRTCLLCIKIRENLFQCNWYYGNMWQDIHEIYCGDKEDECICPI